MSIVVNNLTHIYNEDMPFSSKALDNISIEIKDRELVGLIGHTGSGKSTLIQHLNGLLKPSSGNILINDFDITPRITFTPLEGNYSDSFDILEATIRVSKSIKITDSFSLPLFTEAICAPAYDDAHLIFGLSLSL